MNKPVNGSEEPQYTGWFEEVPTEDLTVRDIPAVVGAIAANTAFVAVKSVELSAKGIARRIKGLAVAAGEGYMRFEYDTENQVCPEKLAMDGVMQVERVTPSERHYCDTATCTGPIRKPITVGKVTLPISHRPSCGKSITQ